MKNPNINFKQSLSCHSEDIISALTERGLLEDQQITDEAIRKAKKEQRQKKYHNTMLLLRQYRNIVWVLECLPTSIAEELDQPLRDLDSLIGLIDIEISIENRKLEGRLKSTKKSRLLLDKVNEAITVLRKKPDNGEMLYNIIYWSYTSPERYVAKVSLQIAEPLINQVF